MTITPGVKKNSFCRKLHTSFERIVKFCALVGTQWEEKEQNWNMYRSKEKSDGNSCHFEITYNYFESCT